VNHPWGSIQHHHDIGRFRLPFGKHPSQILAYCQNHTQSTPASVWLFTSSFKAKKTFRVMHCSACRLVAALPLDEPQAANRFPTKRATHSYRLATLADSRSSAGVTTPYPAHCARGKAPTRPGSAVKRHPARRFHKGSPLRSIHFASASTGISGTAKGILGDDHVFAVAPG